MTVSRKPATEPVVFSIAEVAALLGIHLRAAYELARQPGFPALKVSPRRIVVPKQAFFRWLETATRDSQSSGMA
ncbi:MAG TPA: helix-turn-helix domain-containing protein [bacterium]|jgi:excisionase family DNA binding protein|nr:helix-turn-helix domain-containing protein [bacterium]